MYQASESGRTRNCFRRFFFHSVLLIGIALSAANSFADVRHLYDENGRLSATIGPNGEAVQYEYDAAGNLNGISRASQNGVSISSFTPAFGPTGTTVTISGTGFSATANQNTVEFNGVAAAVSAASTTELTVTVPATATTGPLTVTTSSGTAVAASVFTVGLPAPTISSFTPTAGAAGVAVTVSGQGFDPAAGATTVKFNQTVATVTAISPTSLTATVPSATGSGKISVATNLGTATSAEDFVIPPGSIAAADILARQRVTVSGAAQALAIGTANKYGVLLFDGYQNDLLTVDVSGFSVTPSNATVSYWVYRPNGILLVSGSVTTAARSIHLPALPTTGSYSVYFRPLSATATLAVSVAANTILTADSGSVAKSVSFSGQSVRLAFFVNVPGQQFGLGISGLTLSPTGSTYLNLGVVKPNGSGTGICGVSTGGCGLDFLSTVTGLHTVVLTPVNAGTGSFTATLSSEVSGVLTPGTSLPVSIPRAGQNARLSFWGTAGEQLGLTVNGLTITGSNGGLGMNYNIYQPNGTPLPDVSGSVLNGTNLYRDLPVLPATGTYTIFFNPPHTTTANFNALITADVIVPLNVDGASSNATLTQAGQTARFTFDATAGQKLGFALTNLALNPGSTYVTLSLLSPAGTGLWSGPCSPNTVGCGLDFLNFFTTTGTYTVLVTPHNGGTGSFTATLSSEVTGALTIGTSSPISVTRPGQNARFTFSGTQGDHLGLTLSGVTLANNSGYAMSFTVYKPDGSSLATSTVASGTAALDLPVLPATGTYVAYFGLPYVATGSFNALVTADVVESLNLDGTPSSISITQTGQTARLTFSATAGQKLGLALNGITLDPAGSTYLNVNVLNPAGGSVTAANCYESSVGCSVDLLNLPVSGTYTIVITPQNAGTGGFVATLSSELTSGLTLNTPYSLNIARQGQNGRLGFSGTAGTRAVLTMSSIATTPAGQNVTFIVYRADTGAQVTSTSTTGANATITVNSLPVTGNYYLFVNPTSYGTATMSVTHSP